MQGPSGVDEILMEINDERFARDGGQDNNNNQDDPSKLFEIFSNSGGDETEDVIDDMDGMSTGSGHFSSEADEGIGNGSRRPGSRMNRSRRSGSSIQRRRTLTLD